MAGTSTCGGLAGESGSYEYNLAGKVTALVSASGMALPNVEGDASSSNASNGEAFRGGNGADGKEAGGGGGAGWFGGGGGGSGVDGSGGGGGSGMIFYSKVHDFSRLADYIDVKPDVPQNLQISSKSAKSVELTWMAPTSGFKYPPTGFAIEMSYGTASEDFEILHTEPSSKFHTEIGGLSPLTTYRFRVRALSREDTGLYSQSIVVT